MLAAVLPGTSLETSVVDDAELEPVDQTGPGYRLEGGAGIVQGTAVTPHDGGVRVTTFASSRWPEPAATIVKGVAALRRPWRR